MGLNAQEVLLIEDNRDDVFLMRRAIKKAGVAWNLQVVTDGQEAMDFFAGTGKFSDRSQFPLPSLVFLDLKLPYVSGFEVLTTMKGHPEHKLTPVAVLTSSPETRDQHRAFELGAKAYLIKPPGEEVLRRIAEGDWPCMGQAMPANAGF